HGGDAHYVRREGARRKHDAASRDDLRLSTVDAQHGTANLLAPSDQTDGGCGMGGTHQKTERAAQKPGDECIAVDELHAATMQNKIPEMTQESLADMQGGSRRPGGVEEVPHVGAAGDRHSFEAYDIQGWTEPVDEFAKLAAVI